MFLKSYRKYLHVSQKIWKILHIFAYKGPEIEPEFTALLQFNPKFLREGITLEELNQEQYKLLVKIRRILSEETKISLFKMLEFDLSKLPNSSEIIQKFLSSQTAETSAILGQNLTEEDFYLSSPALIVDVIAIYS